MVQRTHQFVISLVMILLVTHSVQASFIVSDWALGTTIYDVINYPDDRQFFLDVSNPFVNSHTAIAGNSVSTTSYDFTWLIDPASFDISAHQHMMQLDGGMDTGGQIYFTTTSDMTMTLSARYDYNWPASVIGQSAMGFILWDFNQEIRVFEEGHHGGNVGLGPPHGTLEVSGVIPLLAGHDYAFSYAMSTDQYDPSPPGTFGNADGHIHFDIASIPEPVALAPLVLTALILSRRRRRPR